MTTKEDRMSKEGAIVPPFIILTTLIEPDGDQYASICQELGIASCGDTIQEACDNLDDAIALYLNGIEVNGTREQVFREKGIVLVQDVPTQSIQQAIPFDTILKKTKRPVPALV